MKFTKFSQSIVLGLAVVLASTAFASTKHNLQLSDAVNINGTTLKAGDYKLEWDGSGPNVELSILRGKDVVAKVPAHLVELQAPASDDATLTRKNESGPSTLSGVRFHGQKTALDFGDGGDGMQAGGSSK